MRAPLMMLLLLIVTGVNAQETFRLPARLKVLPITYLEELDVRDTNRKLNEKERREICRLFIDAYLTTKRRYGQDYLIEPEVPIYRLFKTNFPEVSKLEGEGGVFLGNLYSFIKVLPDSKATSRDRGRK